MKYTFADRNTHEKLTVAISTKTDRMTRGEMYKLPELQGKNATVYPLLIDADSYYYGAVCIACTTAKKAVQRENNDMSWARYRACNYIRGQVEKAIAHGMDVCYYAFDRTGDVMSKKSATGEMYYNFNDAENMITEAIIGMQEAEMYGLNPEIDAYVIYRAGFLALNKWLKAQKNYQIKCPCPVEKADKQETFIAFDVDYSELTEDEKRAVVHCLEGMTERQKQIIALYSSGYSQNAIALHFSVKRSTIQDGLERIRYRLSNAIADVHTEGVYQTIRASYTVDSHGHVKSV